MGVRNAAVISSACCLRAVWNFGIVCSRVDENADIGECLDGCALAATRLRYRARRVSSRGFAMAARGGITYNKYQAYASVTYLAARHDA